MAARIVWRTVSGRDVCGGGEIGWGVGYMEYGCLFRRLLVVGMG